MHMLHEIDKYEEYREMDCRDCICRECRHRGFCHTKCDDGLLFIKLGCPDFKSGEEVA